MRASHPTGTRGFTILELLIVIAIMLILLALGIEAFSSFSTRSRSDAAAHEIVNVLHEAQARTLSADSNQSYGVHFATTSLTLFEGDTYTASSTTNDVRTFYRAQLSDISLTNGDTDIVFARLRGSASATGTITVMQSDDASQTRTVLIHTTGLAELQ